MPDITPRERRARIALAIAVALLFLTVVASMIAGRVLWVGIGLAAGLAVAGAFGMLTSGGER
jgi:hypothetical protein